MTSIESNNQLQKPRKVLEFDGLDEDWPDLNDIAPTLDTSIDDSIHNSSSIKEGNQSSKSNHNTDTFKGDSNQPGGYGTIRIQQKTGKTLSKANRQVLNSLRLKDGASSVHIQSSDTDSNQSRGTMKFKKDNPWVNRQYNDLFTPFHLESLFSQPAPAKSTSEQSPSSPKTTNDEPKNLSPKKIPTPSPKQPKPAKYPFKNPKLSPSKPIPIPNTSHQPLKKAESNPVLMTNQSSSSFQDSNASDQKGAHQPKAHQLFQNRYDTTTRNWLDNMVSGLDNISKANSITSTSPPTHPSILSAQQQVNNRLKKTASAPSLRIQKPLNFKNRIQANKWDFQNEKMPNNMNERKFTPYHLPLSPTKNVIEETSMEDRSQLSVDQGFTQEWLKHVADQQLNFEGDASPMNLLDEISSSTSQISTPVQHVQFTESTDTTVLTAGRSSFNYTSAQNVPHSMKLEAPPPTGSPFGDISIQGHDLSFSEDSNRNYKDNGNNLLDKTTLSELNEQIQKGMVLNGTSTMNENSFSSANSTMSKPKHSRTSSDTSKHPPVSGRKWADLSVGSRLDVGSTRASNQNSRAPSPKHHSSDMSSSGPSHFQSNPTLLPLTAPTWNWAELLGKESPVNSNKPKLGADKAADHLKKQGVLPSRPHLNDPYLITPDVVGELPDLIGNMKFDMTSRCWIPLSPIGEDPFSGIDEDHKPPIDEAPPETIESPESPEALPPPQMNATRTLTPKAGRDQLHPKRNLSKPISYYRVKPIKSLNSMPPSQQEDLASNSKSFKRNSLRRSSFDSGSQTAFPPLPRPSHDTMQFHDRNLSNNKVGGHLSHSNLTSQSQLNQGAPLQLNPVTYQGVPGWFLSSMELPLNYSLSMPTSLLPSKAGSLKEQGTQTEGMDLNYLPLSRHRNSDISVRKAQPTTLELNANQQPNQYSYFTGNRQVPAPTILNEAQPPLNQSTIHIAHDPDSSVIIRDREKEDAGVATPLSSERDDKKYQLKLTKANLPINPSLLTQIQHLDLSHLGFSELAFCSDLKQLRSVNLDHNKLTTLDWFRGNALQTLSLKSNLITCFPQDYELTELVKLNLEGNPIQSFDGLHNLSSLKYVNLSRNNSLQFTQLASDRCYHPSLKILKLKSSHPDQLLQFSPHWFPKLAELYADGFQISSDHPIVNFNSKLQKLSMRQPRGDGRCALTNTQLKSLNYLFGQGNRFIYDKIPELNLFNLAYLELTDLKLKLLDINLTQYTPQLKGLDVSNNQLTSMEQVLVKCPPTLQFANFNDNQLDERSVVELVESPFLMNLIRLEFQNNSIPKQNETLIEFSLKFKFKNLKFINNKKV